MRICIVGAGAIGGLLAVRLAASGEAVTVVARGAQLEAIEKRGLRLTGLQGEDIHASPSLARDLRSIGPQDLVVLGVKAHQVAPIASDVADCLAPEGLVLTAQNGIPWWYFFGHGGSLEGRALNSVDPGGVIAAHLPIDRVIGSVVYPAAEIAEPGVIRLIEGNRFSLGELDNSRTDRLQAISQVLTNAGFKAPVVTDLRSEIWTK
ncbi:MAG: 2-dehydropantoate 2-reductase, partial [Hyphomicrobiales bacterium]|nr:2-dehydropantoate 2-reductase [Hyphomicrobiales bacterium]